MRLISKALKRIRAYDQAADSVHLHVRFLHDSRYTKRSWEQSVRLPVAANDDITWSRRIRPLLDTMEIPGPDYRPLKEGVAFGGLISCADAKLILFDGEQQRMRLCKTMDELNARFGHVVDFAGVY